MWRFNWQGLMLSLTAVVAFAWGAWAQDSAYVPFKVNVAATVLAMTIDNAGGIAHIQMEVMANVTDTLRLPFLKTDGVRYIGTQRQTNAPAIVHNRAGKITINLPEQSQNVEIALYSVNGKRILRQKVSATNAVNNIMRRNIAIGVYLLSVKGTGGNTLSLRITHGGGGLDINVAFGSRNENLSAISQMTKKTVDAMEWMIAVSAVTAGYKDSVYMLRPIAGTNALQNITLREESSGSGNGSYESVVIGGTRWMKKNLNIATANSLCYENNPDSCAKYGRLYDWETALIVCPNGWHLATNQEWDRLVATVGDMPSDKLKSKSGWNGWRDYYQNGSVYYSGNGTDDFGFSALPSGGYVWSGLFGTNADFYFDGNGTHAAWWTSDFNFRIMYYDSVGVGRGRDNVNLSQKFPVRCVNDTTLPTYTLTVEKNYMASGSTNPANSQSYIIAGQQVSISAMPKIGCSFVNWTITSGSGTIANANSASTTVTVNGNVTVKANFTQNSTSDYGEFVMIGGKWWMSKNLNIDTENSWCYNNNPENCKKYGRLYRWQEAMTVCPAGWKLPDTTDWHGLVTVAAGTLPPDSGNVLRTVIDAKAVMKLGAKNDWTWQHIIGTDNYGFSALPGGWWFSGDYYQDAYFEGAGIDNSCCHGYWWTATTSTWNDSHAYYWHMDGSKEELKETYKSKSNGMSVRCVQD